jgi:RNA polymerase sigma-70 factor (ECF subfamily)
MLSFHEIYERHYRDVYRFALFLTGDPTRAEDLASDTFVRAWTARGTIREPTVRSYLLTITKNLYRDAGRRRRDFVPVDDRIPDASPSVEAQVEHADTLGRVRARLRQVARGDRRALILFVGRGMSYTEIARALGVSVGAVKSRIFRAREALAAAARPEPTNGEQS